MPLRWLFRNKEGELIDEFVKSSLCLGIQDEGKYAIFVIECCINLISHAFCSVHFRVYDKQREVENDISYRLNVAPNVNESAASFWRRVVAKTLRENEAVLMAEDGNLVLADSATVTFDGVLRESRYQLSFNELNGIFARDISSIMRIKLNDENISAMAQNVAQGVQEALKAAFDAFVRDRGRKGIVRLGSGWAQKKEPQEALRELMEDRFRPWFQAKGSAVLPLTNGIEYEELKDQKRDDTSHSRDLFSDICQFMCLAFGIPKNLLFGNAVDSETNVQTFLTLCINPIAKIIESEANRVLYTKEEFLSGSRVEADLSNVRVSSLAEQAKSMDTLFRIGYSVNDILRSMGKAAIPEEWADKHYVTKNYGPATGQEGGADETTESE